MYWIYDIPVWLLGICTVMAFITVSLLGLTASRRWIYLKMHLSDESNEAINGYFAGVGVLYGLLLGLVAVAAWGNYENVDDIASKESAAIAALYRDVSVLEQPAKQVLQQELEKYTRYVIEVAWPAHRKGETPSGGSLILSKFHQDLANYQPQSIQQQMLMAEALTAFNKLIEVRRARLSAVDTGIPAVFWVTILLGTFLNIALSFFFHVSSFRTHMVLTTVYSGFLGSAIFLVIAVDHPFRGDVSVSPNAYVSLLERLKDLDPVQ
jgi:hypothetical protein